MTPSPPPAIIRGYDVLISAGHEGRPASCARFPQHSCNLGARGERTWNPIVANETMRVLRAHGVRVVRLPADFSGVYAVKLAVFIHFDGAVPRCSSAASVGYPANADPRFARSWKGLYGRYFPFGFRPDNFTVNLRRYYAYKQVRANAGAYVLELGEITCPAQHAWLAPRLGWVGDLIAYWIARVIDKGRVPLPANASVRVRRGSSR